MCIDLQSRIYETKTFIFWSTFTRIQTGIGILSGPLCHLSYRASVNFLVIHILLVLQMFQHHATEKGLQSSEFGSGGQRERWSAIHSAATRTGNYLIQFKTPMWKCLSTNTAASIILQEMKNTVGTLIPDQNVRFANCRPCKKPSENVQF